MKNKTHRDNGKMSNEQAPLDNITTNAHIAPKAEDKPQEGATEQQTKKPNLSPLQATIILARRGDIRILPRLRDTLDETPDLWRHCGNLTLQAQESWLQLIAGKNLFMSETLRHHLDAMRCELVGANGNALERLLVDRILACYVQVLYFDSHEGQYPGGQNSKFDQYRMQRQDLAHRQYLSAIKMLTTVRHITVKTIQVEFISKPAMPHAPPIITAANGDKPRMGDGKGKRKKKRPVNKTRGPINKVNRLNGNRNGHKNRLSGIVAPAMAE